MKIKQDLHIHTTISHCCNDPRQTVENIVDLLIPKGFTTLAFTDHIWNNPSVPPSAWYAPQDGRAHRELARTIRGLECQAKLLVGCEADMRGVGKFGVTPEVREEFDIVLMAADHFHMGKDIDLPPVVTPATLAPHMMEFFRSAAASRLADVLAHPLFTLGFVELYDQTIAKISDAEFYDAFALAAANSCAIELNGSIIALIGRKGVSEESMLRVFTLAKRAGATFTYGSDSHHLSAFDDALPRAEAFMDKLELTPDDFLTL